MANPRRTTALAWKDLRPFSCSVGECKFVVKPAFLVLVRCQRPMEFTLFTTGVLPQAFPLAPIGLPAPSDGSPGRSAGCRRR